MKRLFFLLVIFLLAGLCPAQVMAEVTVLHEFAGGTEDGANPFAWEQNLVIQNGVVYGTTTFGGDSNYGTIFKMNVDGTGFTLLHEFAGGADDGTRPNGGLTLHNQILYGMTQYGGDAGAGVIFSMNLDGTGFELLHEFAAAGDNGVQPYGSLLVSGTIMYGMTESGGTAGLGDIFKMNLDGSGYTRLHSFTGIPDGQWTYSTLIEVGEYLYGMVKDNDGIVFKIKNDGTDFSMLRDFSGGVADGRQPYGSLVHLDGVLYGMTYTGGDANAGVIFSMNLDGSGYTHLHEFAGDTTDGGWPMGTLLLNGSTLYGMTAWGGPTDDGTIFSLDIDGSDYQILHFFDGTDGEGGVGNLTMVNNNLYGGTRFGGSSNTGTLFSYALPDIFPPTISNLTPAADSTITTATPTITFSTDENATCRLSLTDESYADMSDDVLCSGGGTTSQTCTAPDLGTNGTKIVYIACIDGLANEDTIDSNESVSYALQVAAVTGSTTPTNSVSSGDYHTPECVVNWDRGSRASIFSGNFLSPSSIRLVFQPAVGADGYIFWYGPKTPDQHTANYANNDSSGMLIYTIYDLYPANEWQFAISAYKGCASGGLSNPYTVRKPNQVQRLMQRRKTAPAIPILTATPDPTMPSVTPTPTQLPAMDTPATPIPTRAPTAPSQSQPSSTPLPELSATPSRNWLQRLWLRATESINP